jgi:hypothetical protein
VVHIASNSNINALLDAALVNSTGKAVLPTESKRMAMPHAIGKRLITHSLFGLVLRASEAPNKEGLTLFLQMLKLVSEN